MTQRLSRIVRILVMLQAGLRCNALRIAAESGVHRRTVFRDFAALRSLGFPIAFDCATGCYFLPRGTMPPSEADLSQLLNLFRDELPKTPPSDSVAESSKPFAVGDANEISTNDDQLIWHDLMASEHLFPEILVQLIAAIESQQRVVLVRSSGQNTECEVTLRLEEVAFKGHGWQVLGVDDSGMRLQLDVESIRECLETTPSDSCSR